MGLRDREWRRFLRGPDLTLVAELYEPALHLALRYDRSCAYFSSSVLAAAARGFGPYIETLLALGNRAPRPAMRLLVNEDLSRDDVDSLLGKRNDNSLAEQLIARLRDPSTELQRDRLAMLGFLVQQNLLEVRVGFLRGGRGIVHAKYGIITDGHGDAVVFSGSDNETASALTANYEELEISGSWSDHERFDYYRQRFDDLWEDRDAAVSVVPLPDAVRLCLIRFVPQDFWPRRGSGVEQAQRRRHEAYMRWRFVMEAPYFPEGHRSCDSTAPVDMWPHQVRVTHEAASAWPAGRLLCDEVGMGKTIEAVIIVRRLLSGRGVRRVLFLVPAGLLRQWQGELREKGGLVVPRLEGSRNLVWPDGETESVSDLSAALRQPLLLVSREYARMEQNVPTFLSAESWDLVLLDEAHAARRARQEEREFNSATRLLALLRHFQLFGQARGVLLLSATPMQNHPWEPWDLLSVLGEGVPWIRGDFQVVQRYYHEVARLPSTPLPAGDARWVVRVVNDDGYFGAAPGPAGPLHMRLASGTSSQRGILGHWLRASAPLGRRMHRNTRATLRRYYSQGLITRPPPQRAVQDAPFVHADPRERDAYDAVADYVDRRFKELESERSGKGFVMTVYRRRATSSPFALKESLRKRESGLHRVIAQRATGELTDLDPEDARDFEEFLLDEAHGPLSSALPEDPKTAAEELRDVQRLLARLDELGDVDSKFDKFLDVLSLVGDDGRPVLVFSEATDTVRYLRDKLHPKFGVGLACYTGDGGEVHDGDRWTRVPKEKITFLLNAGELRVLLCSDAASEGLNLQAAGALINYDLPWNPSRVEQRIGRIDRIGQSAEIVRVANMVLQDSVDERVYEVLSSRCELFRHFVGAMQPVLAEARGMLLGIKPFSEEVLAAVEKRVRAEAASLAAFEESQRPPEGPSAPGVTREDVARALTGVSADGTASIAGKSRTITSSTDALAADPNAWPPFGLTPELKGLADHLLEPGELLPLAIGVEEDGAFRVSVAVWIDKDSSETVERAERLEALLGMWDGGYVDPKRWINAEAQAKAQARARLHAMIAHAAAEERAGLQRQVDAARLRLTREVGRFLLCLVPDAIDLNAAFHEQQARNIVSAERLRRAHALIGYPDWTPELLSELRQEVGTLSANQQKTVLTGSPLDAALADPRWQAADTLRVRVHQP